MAGAYGGTPGTPAPKSVAGGSGDSTLSGAKGYIGWTPDPTNASVNQGNSNAAVTNPGGTLGSIPCSGVSQSQPINSATL